MCVKFIGSAVVEHVISIALVLPTDVCQCMIQTRRKRRHDHKNS